MPIASKRPKPLASPVGPTARKPPRGSPSPGAQRRPTAAAAEAPPPVAAAGGQPARKRRGSVGVSEGRPLARKLTGGTGAGRREASQGFDRPRRARSKGAKGPSGSGGSSGRRPRGRSATSQASNASASTNRSSRNGTAARWQPPPTHATSAAAASSWRPKQGARARPTRPGQEPPGRPSDQPTRPGQEQPPAPAAAATPPQPAPPPPVPVAARPVAAAPAAAASPPQPVTPEEPQSRRRRKLGQLQCLGSLSDEIPDSGPRRDGAAGLMRELMQELQLTSSGNLEESLARSTSFQSNLPGWAETVDNFGIVRKDLHIDTSGEIGRSSLGVVYRGDYQTTAVAVKVLINDARSPSHIREWKSEVAILSRLRHPNVLQMLGAVFDYSQGLAIVTEFCADGTLRKAVWDEAYSTASSWTKRLKNPPRPWTVKLDWLLQITKGMAFLHYKKVFHRDLKASNVLLSGGVAKLTGFGMSGTRRDAEMAARLRTAMARPAPASDLDRTLKESFAVAEQVALRTRRRRAVPQSSPSARTQQRQEDGLDESGNFAYLAPEVWPELPTTTPFSYSADVYSFGVLLIEIITARVPFDNVRSGDEAKVARQIAGNLARPCMPRTVGGHRIPEVLVETATSCLSYDKDARPSFRKLIDLLREELHYADYRLQPCCVPFAADEPGEEQKVEVFDEPTSEF
eukprot:TRINITY_DN46951_c0_g1_i1.p1 TRINITY_DN46951_c0_g1~~TRINITY_DN46951_c0_g1_i1.p1  ORF type:complete len:707 (+),score=184.17 TRINITY_DN46951_c0_g1_i1:62-2122(+)